MNKVLLFLGLWTGVFLQAQELTPRRWSHLPVGSQFAGVGAVYTEANIYFDPVLQAEDVKATFETAVVAYTYSFAWLNRTARIDVAQAYQQAEWDGLLEGSPTRVERKGWSDTNVRLALNILGAPPLQGKEFLEYHQQHRIQTVVGVGLNVTAPTGQYDADKLLNIGANRWVIRPQLGVVHTRNKWSYELTGAIWFYTDNDEFWMESTREQNPLFALQGHIIYTYRPGVWVAMSAANGQGGESRVNGVAKEDAADNFLYALSAGLPFSRQTGMKVTWIRGETQTDTGADSDSVMAVLSHMF
ncbi:transporter [Kiritimatiellota bacterium B12222]|nr:transporter [Kiritimatiellota bacterium B12222]